MSTRQQRRREAREKKQLSRRGPLVAPALSKTTDWPLDEVLITEAWRDTSQLTQILIVRQGPQHMYALGFILVDLACLGVKNAFARVTDIEAYRQLHRELTSLQNMVPTDPNLVMKIIQTAVDYAGNLGFRPNKDLPEALIVLGEADPSASQEEIPVGGPEGKPFFVAGPNDDVQRVIARLTEAVGAGNFNYLVPVAPVPDFFDLDE